MYFKYSAIFIGVVLISFNLEAQNLTKLGIDTSDIPAGLPIGSAAPLFEAKNTEGKMVNLGNIIAQNPVVLIFYRGEWCPVCSKFLTQYTDSLPQIKAAGAEVLFITPNTTAHATKTKAKYANLLQVLPDSDGEIMKAYGVDFKVTEQYQKKIKRFLKADIAKSNNQKDAVLPVPATYIIGENGIILWRHFDLNYKNRATAGAILEHLP